MYGIFLSTGDNSTFWCDDILIKNNDGKYCIFSNEYEALQYMEDNNIKDDNENQYTIEELEVIK